MLAASTPATAGMLSAVVTCVTEASADATLYANVCASDQFGAIAPSTALTYPVADSFTAATFTVAATSWPFTTTLCTGCTAFTTAACASADVEATAFKADAAGVLATIAVAPVAAGLLVAAGVLVELLELLEDFELWCELLDVVGLGAAQTDIDIDNTITILS